jgi:hypothetical protein
MSALLQASHLGAEVFTLEAKDIGQYWPAIINFLLKVENPDWTTDQVYESLINKDSQLWGMTENHKITGILITRIERAQHLYGLIWIAASEGENAGLEKGIPLYLSCVEGWMRDLGCKEIRIHGRRGWKRVLPGFEEATIELRKQL